MKELFAKGGSHYYEPLIKKEIRDMEDFDLKFNDMMEDMKMFGDTRPFNQIFEMMYEKNGLPTYQEYIERCFKNVKNGSWGRHIKWTPNRILLIKERAGRAYASFVIEKQVLDLMDKHFWENNNYCDRKADIKFGVDIISEDLFTGKNFYLHIAKDTPFSRECIERKKARFGGKYSQIGGHIFIWFDRTDSWRTEYIGGQPFVKEEYLIEEINDTDNPKQLNKYVK